MDLLRGDVIKGFGEESEDYIFLKFIEIVWMRGKFVIRDDSDFLENDVLVGVLIV